MSPEARYFNSGVMLINLSLWRSHNVKDRVVSFVESCPNSIQFVDQCGLNSIVNGRWLSLSESYNFQTACVGDSALYIQGTPYIVHFTGSAKPWHLLNTHPYKRKYWHFRNQTSFKRLVSDDFSFVKACKLLVILLARLFRLIV